MSRVWVSQPHQVPVGIDTSRFTPVVAFNAGCGEYDSTGQKTTFVGASKIISGEVAYAIYAGGTYRRIEYPNARSRGDGFTVVVRYKLNQGIVNLCTAANNWDDAKGFILYIGADNTLYVRGGSPPYVPITATGVGSVDGKKKTLAVKFSGTTATVALDGKYIGEVTGLAAAGAFSSGVAFGNYVSGVNDQGASFNISLGAVVYGGDIVALSSNPWQIFQPLPSRIFVGPAAATGDTTLIVADSYHAHAADNVVLEGVGSDTALTVADATHAHYGDSPILTNAAFLAVSDGSHGHTADSITLDGGVVLTVADSTHSHAVDEPSLTTASILAIQDALHSHTAENVILSGTSDVDLTIADALHAHSADNVTLTGDLTDSEKIDLILDILSNKQEVDPSTGLFTLYADDGSTVLMTAAAWEDINGTVPYRGRGLKRLDALH